MICLFDRYDQASFDLLRSLKATGLDCPVVVVQDDGYLAPDVESPYSYFTGDLDTPEGRPIYFNLVPKPHLWEIRSSNVNGEILDMGKKRANIFYRQPTHERRVRAVEWLDTEGQVRAADIYNRKGRLFAQITYDQTQRPTHTRYFDQSNVVVIMENHLTGDIILTLEGKRHIFKSKQEFVVFYLQYRGYDTDRIIYNSLATPFLVAYALRPKNGRADDLLFWQEPIGEALPGNMKAAMKLPHRNIRIAVQDRQVYEKIQSLATPEEKAYFHNIGYIYDYQRLNNMNPEALILTNSDQLEQIEQLLTQLPSVHFHIGAITEMSSHLMGLNRYPNVSLYPNIRPAKVAELFERCDLYLDINISDEILNACRTAFENNMLTLSFKNTCHSRLFIADDHIYAPENVSTMVDKIQAVLAYSSEMEAALARQKQAANQASLEQYKAIL